MDELAGLDSERAGRRVWGGPFGQAGPGGTGGGGWAGRVGRIEGFRGQVLWTCVLLLTTSVVTAQNTSFEPKARDKI